jgi:hypothetical protein
MTALKMRSRHRFWEAVFLVAALAGPIAATADAQLSLACDQSSFPNTIVASTTSSMACLASGGTSPYVYTISAGSLPTGITSLQTDSQLTVQGAPSAAGNYSFTIKLADSAGKSTSQTFAITVTTSLTTVTPNNLTVSVAATLTLNGAGFTNNSAVYFNGSPITSTVQSSTQLTAQVPASLVVAGSLPVYVQDRSTGINSPMISVTATTNPVTLTSISPASVQVNSASFVLTLFGSGFTLGTVVNFGGNPLSSIFTSPNQIAAVIPAAYLTTAETVIVSVAGGNIIGVLPKASLAKAQRVSLSGGGSNSLPFVISTAGSGTLTISCNPATGPTMIGVSFSQTCSVSGGNGPYTWTVTGLPAGLAPSPNGSSVTISGTPTTSQPYSYMIQVSDAALNIAGIPITGAVGTYNITSVSPSSTSVGSSAPLMISVFGNGFTSASQVYFKGIALATQLASSTQLNATIPFHNLMTAGVFDIYVSTVGLSTNSLNFTVGPVVTLSSLSPATLPVNFGAFTLTLNGSGFTPGAMVTFGNIALNSTFVSSTQLTALVPATALAAAQTVSVSVPGGNPLPFVITSLAPGSTLSVMCTPASTTLTLSAFYSLDCTVFGGTAPYTWTVSPMPAGLSSNAVPGSSIMISGTPTTLGVQPFTVTSTDSNAIPLTGSANVNLTVQLNMTGTKVGVFRNGVAFLEDSNGNGLYDAGVDNFIPGFTGPGGTVAGDIPLVGDWTGDGKAKVGIYRSSTGQWFLDANNNGIYDGGDYTYGFGGVANDIPIVGDWLNTGKSCVGIFRSGFFWLLDLNCNGQFDSTTDAQFPFGGISGDVPVVGAWTGAGTRVGVVRKYAPGGVPTGNPFYWMLDSGAANAGSLPANHQPSASSFAFGGLTGDLYVTGDWKNTGISAAGVFRNGLWVLDAALPGAPQASHVPGLTFGYGGVAGDLPVTGKW